MHLLDAPAVMAGFMPEEVGQDAGEDGAGDADPHRDVIPCDHNLTLHDEAAEVREGNEGEDANGNRGEGFHGYSLNPAS